MSSCERLTIDVMVARDYLDAERDGHARSRALFGLARSGEVELALATSGYVIDVLRHEGELAEQVRALLESESVVSTAQLSYPGVMYPDAYPGAFVEGLREAWDAVLERWDAHTHEGRPPERADALHIETHIMEGRDVFLTEERGLLAMCRRLRQHGFAVEAMRVDDYLARRPLTCSHGDE